MPDLARRRRPGAGSTRLEAEPIFQRTTTDLRSRDRVSPASATTPARAIGDLDADVAALAAQLEAFEKTDTRVARE